MAATFDALATRDPVYRAALGAVPLAWLGTIILTHPAQPAFALRDPIALALGVLVYPLFEEIVFRGGLQLWLLRRTHLRRHIMGVTVANVLTSIVFAALHLYAHPPLWAAAVFLPSLVFGFFRDRYQRIAPSIVLHMAYNVAFFMLVAY